MAIKKLIALGCAVLAGLSLVACGSNTGKNNGGNTPNHTDNDNTDNTDNGDNGDDNNNNDDNDDNTDSGAVKLTFDAGDGGFLSGGNSVTLSADGVSTAIKQKGDPRRSGYAFVGWYNGSQAYDASAEYTESTTFTAKYDSGTESVVYDALFDEGSTVTVSIDMSDAEWKKLDNDYVAFGSGKSPIYRMADWVSIGIEKEDGTWRNYWYDEVGVRMKGNTSRRQFYGDDGFYANVHYKLSFKETFDDEDEYEKEERKVWTDAAARKARKNRTFGGMEKLDVKYNKNEDDTYCRDIYAMKLFRDNGIIAPNATLCAVSALNKDTDFINLGVYMLYESVDEIMIARHLPDDADGDLYKCSWGSGFGADLSFVGGIGVEDELNGQFFTYDKKTNKKKGHTNLENFITAINQADPDFSSLIDEDYFAMFEAVNYILGNPDCIRNNKNNYYIYFRKDGRAIFIPYDYDRCFGITKDYNPDGNACKYIAPYTRTTANGSSQSNPLYVKLIDKGAPYGEGSVLMKYRKNLLALAERLESENNEFMVNYALRYSVFTAGALETNNLPFNDNRAGNVMYEEYLLAKLDTLKNNIDNYLA